ncbi:MFS transporter [Georgenia sp. Z1491]|uniref:MFS transporter n=1 Tax=Georgenia sp. Z1491 TaxID=3416707 RepID=UPI003CF58973
MTAASTGPRRGFLGSTFHSLGYFNYRLWFFGSMVANTGTWAQRVAQGWLVLTELTDDSGIAMGIVTGLQFLPALLLSPIAGVNADRVDRRRMLMVTQGSMGILALCLGALVLTGAVELWMVYGFAFALGCASAFDGPVRQTFVSDMVQPADLPNAVGLNSTSFNLARMAGPALAGLAIAWVGTGWVFIANGVLFGATILALTFMRVDELVPRVVVPRARGQFREGLAYVRHRSDLVIVLVTVGVVSSLGMNQAVTQGVMARQIFGRGPEEFGVLGSIMAVGSLLGALMATRRRNPRVRTVILAAFAFGVASFLSALAPTFWWFAASLVPVGFTVLTMLTSANATVQTSTDPAYRGRVMSLYMMVLLGTGPFGAPLVGWIAEVLGARESILVGAVPSILVAAIAALWVRRAWDVRVGYDRAAPRHLTYEGPRERAARAAEEGRESS